jgi:hypothetical protein
MLRRWGCGEKCRNRQSEVRPSHRSARHGQNARTRKAFVTIPEGGHFAVFMKRDAFLHELVARMVPAIRGRGLSGPAPP